MAKKVFTQLIDDLDGSLAEVSITFGLAGRWYQIDLNAEHAAEFEAAIAPYKAAATLVGREAAAPRQGGRAKASIDRAQLQAMRNWGRNNGYKVSERGRLSAELVAAYNAQV